MADAERHAAARRAEAEVERLADGGGKAGGGQRGKAEAARCAEADRQEPAVDYEEQDAMDGGGQTVLETFAALAEAEANPL